MDTSVVERIATSFTTSLTKDLQTLVGTEDATRAGLIRIGLLQASPLVGKVNVLINFNDPDEEKSWYHSIVSGPGDNLGINIPAFEVGGGEMWFRRYTLKMDQFFATNANRALAEQLAQVILSRAEFSIKTAALPQGPDSFGETALRAYLHSSQNIEGGGEGQFIFHGKIWFQVLTEKASIY